MSIETLKLLRPQAGDIVVVDFNKVNITQVENAVKDMNVAVIAVHDIDTIKIFGMREQKDFSEEVQKLQEELSAAKKQLQESKTAVTHVNPNPSTSSRLGAIRTLEIPPKSVDPITGLKVESKT